jgi:hypothetical protein
LYSTYERKNAAFDFGTCLISLKMMFSISIHSLQMTKFILYGCVKFHCV